VNIVKTYQRRALTDEQNLRGSAIACDYLRFGIHLDICHQTGVASHLLLDDATHEDLRDLAAR